jgi:hypothetical protein
MAIRSLAQSSVRQNPQLNSMLAGFQPNQFHHLETVRLGGSASSIEFTNLSRYADYQHLQLRTVVRIASGLDGINLRLNGDTGTNYANHLLYGDGGSALSGSGTSQSFLSLGLAPSASNVFGGSITDLLDAFDSSKNKVTRVLTGEHDGTNRFVQLRSGLWLNTSAVTSMQIYPNSSSFVAGCRFSLYGLKAKA